MKRPYVPTPGSNSERLIAALASIGPGLELSSLDLANSVGVQAKQVHGLLFTAQHHGLVQRRGGGMGNGALQWSLTLAGRDRFATSSVVVAAKEIVAHDAHADLETIQRVIPATEGKPLASGRVAWWGGIEA